MRTKTAISKSKTSSSTRSEMDTQIFTVSLAVVSIFAGLAGVFAFAALIGGMISAGGPTGLVSGWIKAVFGV